MSRLYHDRFVWFYEIFVPVAAGGSLTCGLRQTFDPLAMLAGLALSVFAFGSSKMHVDVVSTVIEVAWKNTWRVKAPAKRVEVFE